MKHILLIVLCLTLLSCKKDPVYGPLGLKDGQEVELLVDHRWGGKDDVLLTYPGKLATYSYLEGFDEREAGYTYRVKAVFHNEAEPLQDGPSFYFKFLKIVNKQPHKDKEVFTIQLIRQGVIGGPTIQLGMKENKYYFIPDKIELTAGNTEVEKSLAEINEYVGKIRSSWPASPQFKWKGIQAIVTHDVEKFGTAYKVQQIIFTP